MSGKEKRARKKHGFFGILFGTIGALVFLVILAAAGLGYYVIRTMKNDPITVATLKEYAKEPADTSFCHIAFTEEGWMTQTFCDSDVRYFLSKYMEDQKIDPNDYADQAGIDGLELEGITAGLVPGQLEVGAVGGYKGIRLVARIYLDLTYREGEIAAVPDRIKVAGVTVPVSLIDRYFKTDIQSMSFEYKPDEVFLSSIESMEVTQGRISFRGPMNTFIIDDVPINRTRIMLMRLGQRKVKYAGAAIGTKGTDPAVRYGYVLGILTEDPEHFKEFLGEAFSVTSAARTVALGISYKNYGMAMRWYPEYDANDFTSPREETYDTYYVLFRYMLTMSNQISSSFSSGRLKAGSDQFYYNSRPFSFQDFFGSSYKLYNSFFGRENARMCTVRKEAGGQRYVGILLRGVDDYGYVLAVYSPGQYEAFVMNEDAFVSLMDSQTTPQVILSDMDLFDGNAV